MGKVKYIEIFVGLILDYLIIIAPTAVADHGECKAYCDDKDILHSGFECQKPPKLYCCGNRTSRTCCSNSTLDISDKYSSICECPNYTCVYPGWQALLGAIVFIISTLIMILVCCKVCVKTKCNLQKPPDSRRAGRRSSRIGADNTEVTTISAGIETGQNTQSSGIFNPSHPYAFAPPDYESLAKDLPKYEDIFTASDAGTSGTHQSGIDNLAYSQGTTHENQHHRYNPDGIPPAGMNLESGQGIHVHQNHERNLEIQQEVRQEDTHPGRDRDQTYRQRHPLEQRDHSQHQQQQQQLQQGYDNGSQNNLDHSPSRLILVTERSDLSLGPPEGSPPPSPPPPYDYQV